MIAFLEGTISGKTVNSVIINVNGIGFKVNMPQKTISEIENNSKIKIYTYMRILQDDISLFGFLTSEELSMFELLISVGGIGAKSALTILSNIEPSKFALAVITDDIATLKKLPGIGAKTAERITLELRDKIDKEEIIEDSKEEINKKNNNTQKAKDAIDALLVLGYTRKDIENSLKGIENIEEMEVEDIIKQCLKLL